MDKPKSNGSIAVGRISLAVQANDSIYFFNSDLSNCYRIPSHSQDVYLNEGSCSMTGINSGLLEPALKVDKRDLYDNLLSEEVYQFPEPADAELIYGFTPSPDYQWIAYKQVTGEYFRSLAEANQTDVKLVRLGDSETLAVINLSDHAGAHHANLTWSPDGRYLAFPDFDSSGVTQIYLYEPVTGKKMQLSNFTDGEKEYGISHLAWSGDSTELIFVKVRYRQDEPYLYGYSGGGLGAISTTNDQVRWIIPFNEDLDIRSIHANSKGDLLVFSRRDTPSQEFTIRVYAISSGTVSRTISPSMLKNMVNIAFVIPLDVDFNRFVIDFGPTFVYDDNDHSQNVITSYPFFFSFKVITTPTGSIGFPSCGL